MAEDIYDLRSFIRKLDEIGEITRVKAEVDWKYELGAVTLRSMSLPVQPALVFEKIKGYNSPVFANGLITTRKIAVALGFAPEIERMTMVQECARRLEHPFKPLIVKNGPCKENKYYGNEVNVLKLPVPWWTEKDGGRYIGTWHQVVAKDPETGWTNAGTYRMMVHEPNICGIHFSPFQHIALIYAKYQKMNQAMPVAITIGNDPVCELVSVTPFPAGINEWDMAGALRGRPLEVVKGETVDLEIPSHSEIVLEGEMPPSERRLEGPFGEHTGYYAGGRRPSPIVKIKCMTHRNNPIFRGSILRRPITEGGQVLSFVFATQAMAMYKAAGFPGVTAVHYPAGGDSDFSAIIAIKKSYFSHGLDAARLLLSSKGGKMLKHVIVVDDDINIFDLNEVLWAINTRLQAGRQVYITHNESGSRLDPSVQFEYLGITDKMILDATWPTTPNFLPREEWDGHIHPPEIKVSEELGKYIEKRWSEYGIK